MSIYYRPPTNPDGSRKSYAQRGAERRQADAERRAAQKNEPTAHDPIYDLPYHERARLRRAEAQGRAEAKRLAAIEERQKMQAAIDATPEHLRRPENIYDRLIAAHEHTAYRTDVAARIKKYKKLAVEREKEIDREMAEKLREFEVASNPETKPAMEHWEKASAGAESEEERREWARLLGIINAGAANRYWEEVQPIMEGRLTRMKEKWGGQISEQARTMAVSREMADQLAEVEELQVPSPVKTGDKQGQATEAATAQPASSARSA